MEGAAEKEVKREKQMEKWEGSVYTEEEMEEKRRKTRERWKGRKR